MTQIVFRDLPGVSTVELQREMQCRDHLLDDEVEELPHLIDDTSIRLFGITQRDTFHWALPDPVRGKYRREQWEENFDILGQYSRDPNTHWKAFDLDFRCENGGGLHCFEVFGRQLVCALRRIHPQAGIAFADPKTPQAA